MSSSGRLVSVHPVLDVDDLEASLAYYSDKLGFTVSWKWGSPPFRAGVARDGIELQLSSDPGDHSPSPSQLYFHMQGVEAYYEQCTTRGANVTSELAVRPWGMRDFRVADPAGNRLGFGEPV